MVDLSFIFPRVVFSKQTVNGLLKIIKVGNRFRVTVANVTQSIFDTDLINKNGYWQGYINIKDAPQTALILGYGAGTADFLLRQKFPQVNVVGVEVDPVIAFEARKFLFPQLESPVYIQSAQEFLKTDDNKFDVIFCDMFSKDQVDEAVFDGHFWLLVINHLRKEGLVIVNRIFDKDNLVEVGEFERILRENFQIIEVLKIKNPTRHYNCLFYIKAKNRAAGDSEIVTG